MHRDPTGLNRYLSASSSPFDVPNPPAGALDVTGTLDTNAEATGLIGLIGLVGLIAGAPLR